LEVRHPPPGGELAELRVRQGARPRISRRTARRGSRPADDGPAALEACVESRAGAGSIECGVTEDARSRVSQPGTVDNVTGSLTSTCRCPGKNRNAMDADAGRLLTSFFLFCLCFLFSFFCRLFSRLRERGHHGYVYGNTLGSGRRSKRAMMRDGSSTASGRPREPDAIHGPSPATAWADGVHAAMELREEVVSKERQSRAVRTRRLRSCQRATTRPVGFGERLPARCDGVSLTPSWGERHPTSDIGTR